MSLFLDFSTKPLLNFGTKPFHSFGTKPRDELKALSHQDDARWSGVEVSAGSVWVAPVFGMEDHCELISRSKKTENCALDLRCNWITEAAAFDQQAADRRATPGVEADAAYLRRRPRQKQATCPVCLCELSSPIFQCQNGHLICGPCLERPNTTTHGPTRWTWLVAYSMEPSVPQLFRHEAIPQFRHEAIPQFRHEASRTRWMHSKLSYGRSGLGGSTDSW